MSNISIKLPPHVLTLVLPKVTTTQQANVGSEFRITEDAAETRITEDGEERVVEEASIYSYPELVTVKLPNQVISVSVPK